MKGYLSLVLHAHLPYVRHPESNKELAEDWLNEAITETYIPLLNIMDRLYEKDVDFDLTLNLSPTLVQMLNDDYIQNNYQNHLEKLIELSEKEVERTENQPKYNNVAKMYHYLFKEAYHVFHEKYNNNLLNGFREMEERGNLNLITSAATHGYLPLMFTREGQNAQIEAGINNHQNIFGSKPEGIWLPECGFTPELDPILEKNNIKYFISSTHGILHADPRPRYGVYAPVYTPQGVAAFGRDYESSKQVWSADEGYPGDYNYREFYRDIGYDLDYDYIKPYLPQGKRKQLGIKYYKITGDTEEKDVYIPEEASEKAAEHAGNFLFNRQQQIKYLNQNMDREPIIVAPYDAELFGHWWFEGPQFIEYLFEKIHYDQDDIETITPSEYLKKYPENQISMPSESSWGYKGYHEVWLNEKNDWIYRHLHEAELRMNHLAEKLSQEEDELIIRALNQSARELLLAQSSDWAFIMKTDTMVDYAKKRTKNHLNNFFKLTHQLNQQNIDSKFLNYLENKNNIFPELDYSIFGDKNFHENKEKELAYIN